MDYSLIETLENFKVFGCQFADFNGLCDMCMRFLLNVIVVGCVARFFYYPRSKRRDYLFTFMLISMSIFMLVYLMEGTKLKVGAALGLFAIFGIIRYRTEQVPIREMTYLFFVVSLSVINSMAGSLSIVEWLCANLLFVLMSWLVESAKFMKHSSCKYIKYDNIQLIKPERRQEMIQDLSARTGLKISSVEVGSIDFLRDCALIKVYYEPVDERVNSVNDITRLPKEYE